MVEEGMFQLVQSRKEESYFGRNTAFVFVRLKFGVCVPYDYTNLVSLRSGSYIIDSNPKRLTSKFPYITAASHLKLNAIITTAQALYHPLGGE
jgi:hypothetical protein